MNIPTVHQLLSQRYTTRSVPLKRNDPYKLWLSLESGGQAGAILGGFVSAFEKLNLLPCFDGIIGCSAGAMTGAYFASQQACLGTTIYPENNCDGRFLNPWRILTRDPVMDLDYLVDEVMVHVKPLQLHIQPNTIPIFAIAARRDGKKRFLPLHNQPQSVILQNLKTSARVPIWGSRHLNAFHLWDGALALTSPVMSAFENGATHVLNLSRRPFSETNPRPSMLEKLIQFPILKLYAPDILSLYKKRYNYQERYYSENVYKLALSIPKCSISTTNKTTLWNEIAAAYRHAEYWFLGQKKLPWPEEWVPYFTEPSA